MIGPMINPYASLRVGQAAPPFTDPMVQELLVRPEPEKPWYERSSFWTVMAFGLALGLALDATRKKGLFDPRGPRVF